MAALALLAGVATWFGYDATLKEREATAQRQVAEQQRQVALARQLTAQASLLADRAGSEAIVERVTALAVESWRRIHNADAMEIANRFLTRLPSTRIARIGQPIAFSPDARLLATRDLNTVRLIETESGKEVARITYENTVWDVTFSPDSRLLASASQLYTGDPRSPIVRPGTARLIEAASGKEVARIAYDDRVSGVAFSPDSRWLATRGGSTTRLFETASGTEVARMPYYGANTVAFTPDSRWLVMRGGSGARLIEAATGKEAPGLDRFDDVAFSPDSRWLATASQDGTARLIEAAAGTEVARITGISTVAFSPDSRWLATGSDDGTARLIEAESGKEVARIAHDSQVWTVAFSPDSRWLATASGDNMARLIETASGTEVARITNEDGVSAVAFSPDGRLLTTSRAWVRRVRLLWADPQHVFDLLCAKAGRNLSPDEWRTYIGGGEPWRPTCPNWRNAEVTAQDR